MPPTGDIVWGFPSAGKRPRAGAPAVAPGEPPSQVRPMPVTSRAKSAPAQPAAENNPYDDMLACFDRAAGLLGLDPGQCEILKTPERELKVAIPVRMDDGSFK